MKSLTELETLMSFVPCRFAKDADSASVSDEFSKETGNGVTLRAGFPAKYSTAGSANALIRGDWNRIGEMATREWLFRKCGCLHSFNGVISGELNGFPLKCVFRHVDENGPFLRLVENECQHNTVDFSSDESVINSYTRLPTEGQTVSPHVIWKDAGLSYGVGDNDILNVGVNFSEPTDIAPGESVEKDSLVSIGFYIFAKWHDFWSEGYDNTRPLVVKVVLQEQNGTSQTVLAMPNKGKHGMSLVEAKWLIFNSVYSPSPLCGTGNYDLGIFVKKGTAITCYYSVDSSQSTWEEIDSNIKAFPLSISTSA